MADVATPGMAVTYTQEGAPLCFSPSNSTMWAQACDKHQVNKKMIPEMEEIFAPWVIEKCKRLKDTKAIPHPSHAVWKWVSEAWHAISDDELHSPMRKAIFPNGLKFAYT